MSLWLMTVTVTMSPDVNDVWQCDYGITLTLALDLKKKKEKEKEIE